MLKKIEAIVRQSKMSEVLDELNRQQVYGVTVTQVMGCGKQKGRVQHYRGSEHIINLHPKSKLEIVVKDSWVEQIIEAIIKVANTGEIGDGKIFIHNMEDAVRIRTGERGEDALV